MYRNEKRVCELELKHDLSEVLEIKNVKQIE